MPPRRSRQHLVADAWEGVVYAIGDVHGCLAQLRALESKIAENEASTPGKKWIVLLGDYIDRGPESAGVIDYLLGPPPLGFERFCLAGNHETMMLDFLAAPSAKSTWLASGGRETLASYGLPIDAIDWSDTRQVKAMIFSYIPAEHIEFLRELALYMSLPGTLLVHAGIRPGIALEWQREEDLLWIRPAEFEQGLEPGLRIVHGHTPAATPVITPNRLGIDTGAFATGVLTAARLTPTSHSLLQARPKV